MGEVTPERPAACGHQSEPSASGVFRCTKPEGHEGPHQSAQAHWWSDPPSHERPAASVPVRCRFGLHEKRLVRWDVPGLLLTWRCRRCFKVGTRAV